MKTLLVAAFLLLSLNVHAVKKGGMFKFWVKVHPEVLNPLQAHDNYSLLPMMWMMETMLVHDVDTYEWVPKLAEKWEVSNDGKTFTFDLRKGVKFHDGKEMTAEDVEYSFNVYKNNDYGVSATHDVVKNFEKIEILDKYKIRFHAQKAFADNLQNLGSRVIVPKHVYSGKNPLKMTNTVVGTGPYRLKEYHQGTRLILEANPDWWGRALPENKDRYNFAGIITRFVDEENLKLEMLEKGDLDFAEMTMDSALKRTNVKPWGEKVFLAKAQHAGIYTTQQSLFLNLRNPIFSGVKTRRALQMLYNRKLINEKFRGDLSLLATGPWHRLSEYADPKVKVVPFDEQEAARLLKEDGWQDAEKSGVLSRMKDGVRQELRFNLVYILKDQERFLTIYQADLQRAGVDLKLQQTDHTLFMKLIDDLKYDMYIVGRGWPGVIDFNPKSEWNSAFTSPRQGNTIGYKNPKVDKLMDQAELELDRKKRIKLLREAYRLIAEDQSQVYTFSDDRVYFGHSARLKVDKPSRKYELGIDNWWIE